MSTWSRPPLPSSLRWRLSAAISGVVALSVAVCVAVAVIFLRQALTDRARADLQRTLDGVSGYMDIQRSYVLGAAELVADDPAVGAAVRTGNQHGLIARLTLYYTDLNANVLDVIDGHGRVLAHLEQTENTRAYSGVGRTWPSVRLALAGQEVTAFDTDMPQGAAVAGYALRATVPLRRGPQIIGAVVVGRQLDSIYAKEIGSALNATVNLLAGTERTGSTLTDSNGLPATGEPVPQAVLARMASGKTTIAQAAEEGHAVLSGLVPLPASEGPPVAAVEVVSPLDPLYNMVTQLSFLLLALGAGVVVVGIALALSISRWLTARLRELEAAAAHVAAVAAVGAAPGAEAPLGDLHAAVAVRGTDEVASLARSFGAMMQALDERMDANARLYATAQRQSEHFASLVRTSPVAIVTVDLEGTIVSWNPAAEKLFGYTEAEAIGRDLVGLVTTDDIRAEAVGYLRRSLSGDRVHAITRRARKDGTLVDVELLSVPVFVAGEQVGDIAIYHDISELQRARQEAEAADHAKSAFLATMSHEIRTPMNAIIGMTGLLLNTPLTPEQQEYVEIVRNSGDALLTIINDILDFSKIEAGKFELDQAPFDLRTCLEDALDVLATQAAQKGLDLAYLIDDGTPAAIVSDVARVRQILINLLTNAVKFTEQGEVVLSVTARPLGDERHEVHFAVRDTGIGIPADRLNRLFQPFRQVDTSTARKYGGTGLGLAISKRLSELMGGTMWVESAVGEGSTFHVTIIAEAAPAAAVGADLRREQRQMSGKRLLIVDDNATNRRIVVQHTRSWGMLARDTASPAEALEWIRRGDPFDVAILDMRMPEMDGLTLARAIRTYRDAQALPLVLFSSLMLREAGADSVSFAAYLSKPLKPPQLFEALVGILAGQRGHVAKVVAAQPQLDPEMSKRLPLRILLAEDNTVNQKLVLRLLGQMGYRADVAGNGLEALAALERQHYDVVLMDVQMPEVDGLEASRQICQRWPPLERPRLIALTANAMQGDRERCLEAGMDDYIGKPIRIDELVGALSACHPLERASQP